MKYLKHRLIITLSIIAAIAALLSLLGGSTSSAAQPQGNAPDNKFRRSKKPVPGQYVVVLRNDTRPEQVEPAVNQLLAKHPGNTRFVFKHALKGFSIAMPEEAAIALSRDPMVEYVEEDGIVSASTIQNAAVWGIDRIDQRDLPDNQTYTFPNVSTGAGVHAYVIDSGIQILHEEFRNNSGFTRASNDANFVWWDFNGTNDCSGHGTFVAGVIGGDSFGVAKDVRLHNVRVLDCSGFGWTSTVIAGIDWVSEHHQSPAVVNLSLGASVDNGLEDAIRNSITDDGLTYVVAAGNDNADAKDTSPARMPEVITVGGIRIGDDRRVADSNFGPAVDVFAPGESITSASIDDFNGDGVFDQATAGTGTSFAAPHVTGVVARFLQTNPTASPAVVQGAVKNSATPNKVVNPGAGSPNLLLYSDLHTAFARHATSPPINEFDTLVDSGVDVGPNEWLALTGSGTINAGVLFGGDNGPEGWNSIDNNPALPLPGSRPFALLGILNSQPFYIGRSAATSDNFAAAQRLFLRTNDDVPGNGTGAFGCDVEVWKKFPDASSNFVNQSVPKTILLPGETMNVSVTMRNLGRTTWTAGQMFRLGALGNQSWGVNGRASLPNDVPPDTNVTLNFTVAAPAVPGNYTFQWRMLQENVQFFGDVTTAIPITVLAPSNQAQFVSQSVPTSMYAGESYSVSVTMRNVGNTTWPAGSTYKLGSQNPQDNMTWGLNRVVLTQAVAPGGQVTFNFVVSAPGPKGNFNFQWRMVQEGVEWFGAQTPNVVVAVKLPPCLRC